MILTPKAVTEDSPTAPPTVWASSSYFGEGLPWSLLHQVAAEFFTAMGLSAQQIGYTSVLHGTHLGKFIWGPIVDLFGSLRQWMLATQVLLGIVTGILAILAHRFAILSGNMAMDTQWIWIALVILGILSATYDISCDGYYMEALDRKLQASYSGIRVAAFRAAMFVGSAGLVYIGGHFSWLIGFGLGALLFFLLAIFHGAYLPKFTAQKPVIRPQNHLHSSLKTLLLHVRSSYLSFLFQPHAGAIILFILSYKLGDTLLFNMSKVLFRDLGFTTESRALLNAFGVAAMILGAMIGGTWIARKGLIKALLPISLLMAVTEPLYLIPSAATVPLDILSGMSSVPAAYLKSYAPSFASLATLLMIEQFFGGMATAAQMVFIMQSCHPTYKATHFAFATAMYSFTQMLMGPYSGFLYETWGPIPYFALASVACIPCLLIIPWLPKKAHVSHPP